MASAACWLRWTCSGNLIYGLSFATSWRRPWCYAVERDRVNLSVACAMAKLLPMPGCMCEPWAGHLGTCRLPTVSMPCCARRWTARSVNSVRWTVLGIKRGPKGPVEIRSSAPAKLLDLRFLELDVLARDRVVLLLDQLVGHGARILLGDVVEAGIRRGNELTLMVTALAMFRTSNRGCQAPPIGPHLPRNLASDRPKSRFSGLKPAKIEAINPQRTGFSAAAGPNSLAGSFPHTRSGKSRASAVPAPLCRRNRRIRQAGTGT